MQTDRISMFIAVLFFAASTTQGTLIAEYNFDGGSMVNSVSVAYSPLTVIGAAPDLSGDSYHSDGNSSNYLEVAPAVGGANPWTVSVWVYTDDHNQGSSKGIFSNNDAFTDSYSFELVDDNGDFRSTIRQGGNITRQIGAESGVWKNLVIRKTGGSQGDFFVDGVMVGSLFGNNPGGLQEFRIGTNRDSNGSFTGLIDNVQIWRSIESATAIYAAGPGLNAANAVPEPATATLALLGLGGLMMRRRRNA